MITYELMILFRVLSKLEIKPILKRTAEAIYNKGGVLRKLESLGTRDMPYKVSANGEVFNKASYFLYEFHVPPSSIDDLYDEYDRDVDIIRHKIYKKLEPEVFECTLDEELKPPPYRPDVQKLMKQVDRQEKKKKKFNFGIDYYPFQR